MGQTFQKLSNDELIKSQQMKGSLNLIDLNEDVMLSIFSYFTLEELLLLSQVCIRWKTIIKRVFVVVKCVHFTPVIGLPFEESSHSRAESLNNKQILVSLNRINKSKDFMSSLISECLNLKSINLVGLDFDDNYSPFRLVMDSSDSDISHMNCSHLHNKCNFMDKRICIKSQEMKQFVEKFPNIVHFNTFRSWFSFTEESIRQLISGLTKLQSICFSKETDCTQNDSNEIICGDYFEDINPDIQVIKVTKKILGRNGLLSLTKRVQCLKELRIDIIDSIDDLKLICQHLKTLRCLSFRFEISSEHKLEAFRLMSSLHQLEVIDIVMSDTSEENEITSDSCLLQLMEKTPNMRSIILTGKITEMSLQFVDQFWPKLEKLLIKSPFGSAISSAIIANIAKLKHLNYLDLNNSNITDEDVIQLMVNLKRIRFLNLSGTRITNRTVDFLSEMANSMPNEIFEINLRRTSVKHCLNGGLPYNLVTH